MLKWCAAGVRRLSSFVYQQSACLTVTKRLISNHGQSVGVLLWLSWGSVFKVPRLVLCDHRPRMSGVDTYLLGLSVLPKSKTPSSPVVLWHDCFQMMPWNGHHCLVQGETEWIFLLVVNFYHKCEKLDVSDRCCCRSISFVLWQNACTRESDAGKASFLGDF